ncbi:MAG: ABC transporter ATP-binding protein [Ilumatobacteraceae bacterium]
MADDVLLEVRDVTRHFAGRGPSWLRRRASRGAVKALDGVSFGVRRGENFGLVGESGSGKTTLARIVLQLDAPTAGHIVFDGRDLVGMDGAGVREFRSRTHIVFQDPNGSLSPRMKVADIVAEPIAGGSSADRRRRVAEVLELVGLPADAAQRYPHEFSGGQRQRVAIARAIANRPELLVLDEPVSALDVSIRSQILNLLRDLQDELGLTYLTIAHDLAVVYQACDRTGVLYLGKLAELGPSEALFKDPLHPYTKALVAAIPLPDPTTRPAVRAQVSGEIPSPSNPPSGCRFHTRCPIAMEQCRVDEPVWTEARPGRWVACHAVVPAADGAVAVATPRRSATPIV